MQDLEVPTSQEIANISTEDEAKDKMFLIDSVFSALRKRKAELPKVNAWGGAYIETGARYGELLGKGKAGAPKGNENARKQCVNDYTLNQEERNERKLARKLAAGRSSVPAYVAQCTDSGDVVNIQGFLRFIAGGGRFVEQTGKYEWYTPAIYIDAVKRVMGKIDLDPASCAEANKTVNAEEYYSEEDDGLDERNAWHGNVFCNPPYKMPEVEKFSVRMAEEYIKGNITQGILLTNNSTDTQWWQDAIKVAGLCCLTYGRIKFQGNAQGEIAAPIRGQSFIYFGKDSESFDREFSSIGVVLKCLK